MEICSGGDRRDETPSYIVEITAEYSCARSRIRLQRKRVQFSARGTFSFNTLHIHGARSCTRSRPYARAMQQKCSRGEIQRRRRQRRRPPRSPFLICIPTYRRVFKLSLRAEGAHECAPTRKRKKVEVEEEEEKEEEAGREILIGDASHVSLAKLGGGSLAYGFAETFQLNFKEPRNFRFRGAVY